MSEPEYRLYASGVPGGFDVSKEEWERIHKVRGLTVPEKEPEYSVKIVPDADGYALIVGERGTDSVKHWRFDKIKDKPNHYLKYRVDQKPTTRTHEIVELGPEVGEYLASHASQLR